MMRLLERLRLGQGNAIRGPHELAVALAAELRPVRRQALEAELDALSGEFWDLDEGEQLAAAVTIALELAPKQKRPAGERCCEPVVYPEVDREHALRMAEVAKALADPVRLQLVDVLRKHSGQVCVCELVPLFDISQPTLSHHLKKLREVDVVGSERRGLWVYYYVNPEALEELSRWLSPRE